MRREVPALTRGCEHRDQERDLREPSLSFCILLTSKRKRSSALSMVNKSSRAFETLSRRLREFLQAGWLAAWIWPFAAKCTGDVPAESARQRTDRRLTKVPLIHARTTARITFRSNSTWKPHSGARGGSQRRPEGQSETSEKAKGAVMFLFETELN
jgi:hypothetical protein